MVQRSTQPACIYLRKYDFAHVGPDATHWAHFHDRERRMTRYLRVDEDTRGVPEKCTSPRTAQTEARSSRTTTNRLGRVTTTTAVSGESDRAVALVTARRQRSQPGPTLLGLPVDGVYSIWCDEDDDHPALVRDLHRDDEEE